MENYDQFEINFFVVILYRRQSILWLVPSNYWDAFLLQFLASSCNTLISNYLIYYICTSIEQKFLPFRTVKDWSIWNKINFFIVIFCRQWSILWSVLSNYLDAFLLQFLVSRCSLPSKRLRQNKIEVKVMASAARSPQLRKDAVTNRWVIFSPARAKRPSDFKSKSPTTNSNPNQECPFCIGHEHECAPEIFRVPPDNSDWKIRVIQNLYPALSRQNPDSNPVVQDSNTNSMILDGLGFHDVVIESPLHSIQLCDLSPQDIGDVVLAYRTRILQIMCYNSIKYVQVAPALCLSRFKFEFGLNYYFSYFMS